MIFNEVDQAYLDGVSFSNGKDFKLTSKETNILYRDDYLIDITRAKKVIHLGFVDHLPLIDKKISEDRWLHKKLMNSCSKCYGIDINKEGIEYIQNKYKYEDLYALDIINDAIPSEILDTKIDYLLIPDVLEHIGNPVAFLSAIRERFKDSVEKIIITTPNAFRLNNFINSLKYVERINTDHRFWFTPYTLAKVVTDAGLKINTLDFYEHGKLSRRQILRKMILSKYTALKDTLILDVNLK